MGYMKFVNIKMPYSYLTTVLDCVEATLINTKTEEEKEKIRHPYYSLLSVWEGNAEKEPESDLYFQEEVDREQEIEDEEKSYEADN